MATYLKRFISAAVVVGLLLSVVPLTRAAAEDVTVSVGVGDTTTLIQGSTSPSALVTFMDGAAVIGTTTADSGGNYSKLFTAQTPGLHTYQIFAQDTRGRITDTVTTTVNVQEHFQTTINVFLPPTIALSSNEVRHGETITIQGATAPLAEVVIYIDNESYIVVTAGGTGEWQHTLDTSDLTPGEHQLYAVAIKSGGAQSYPTSERTFIILQQPSAGGDTTPGTPPPTTGPSLPHKPKTPRITAPKSGAKTSDGWIDVRGTAEPGTQVEIWNRGRLVGSVFTDAQGNWWLRLYLSEFANELQARACRGDVCSDFSAGVKVFREAPLPSKGLDLKLNKYRLRTFVRDPVTLVAHTAGGDKPYQLVIDWGDGEKTRLDNANNHQFLTHRFKEAGQYNGTASVTDAEGRFARVFFSTEVAGRPGFWPSWLVVWFLLILLVALMIAFIVVTLFKHKSRRVR